MKKYIIDRFEEDFAVIEDEDGNIIDVNVKELKGADEGDVVILKNGEYVVDKEETKHRRENIEERMKRIFNKKCE